MPDPTASRDTEASPPTTCPNCGARLNEHSGRDSLGRPFCCVYCSFNPEGCRCLYGEPGVPNGPEQEA